MAIFPNKNLTHPSGTIAILTLQMRSIIKVVSVKLHVTQGLRGEAFCKDFPSRTKADDTETFIT